MGLEGRSAGIGWRGLPWERPSWEVARRLRLPSSRPAGECLFGTKMLCLCVYLII